VERSGDGEPKPGELAQRTACASEGS